MRLKFKSSYKKYQEEVLREPDLVNLYCEMGVMGTQLNECKFIMNKIKSKLDTLTPEEFKHRANMVQLAQEKLLK